MARVRRLLTNVDYSVYLYTESKKISIGGIHYENSKKESRKKNCCRTFSF